MSGDDLRAPELVELASQDDVGERKFFRWFYSSFELFNERIVIHHDEDAIHAQRAQSIDGSR